jgi:hypothetical protein
MLSQFTKRQEFSPDSPFVRRFGVQGLRRFYAISFFVLYGLLAALAGRGAWALTRSDVTDTEPYIIYIAAALTVTASALLTKLLIGYWREIDQLETRMKRVV